MKIVNIILGIATALILAALINLGIKAFYPEPTPPDYNTIVKPYVMPIEISNCDKADKECLAKQTAYNAEQQKEQELMQQKQRAYDDAMKVYNRDYFIIANTVGIVVFIISFWFLMTATAATQSALIGFMLASLWTIFFGYIRGWNSVDDRLKFMVGLVVAAIVVGGSIWLLQRHYAKKAVTQA